MKSISSGEKNVDCYRISIIIAAIVIPTIVIEPSYGINCEHQKRRMRCQYGMDATKLVQTYNSVDHKGEKYASRLIINPNGVTYRFTKNRHTRGPFFPFHTYSISSDRERRWS